jgi:hypothetical protein
VPVKIRPINYEEVTAASLVVQGGSLTPEFENEDDVDACWEAVEETRRRREGVYRIQLTSRNVREDAHHFYLANGYQLTSQGFKKLL